MTQYCRYCSNLVTGNGIYCEAKQREFSESYCKSPNRCKLFEFNEMDAFDENRTYKPRIDLNRPKNLYEAITAIQMIFPEFETTKSLEAEKMVLCAVKQGKLVMKKEDGT